MPALAGNRERGVVEQPDAADEVRAFTMAALAADLGVLRTISGPVDCPPDQGSFWRPPAATGRRHALLARGAGHATGDEIHQVKELGDAVEGVE
jgi:hypothetical protein